MHYDCEVLQQGHVSCLSCVIALIEFLSTIILTHLVGAGVEGQGGDCW